MQKGSVEILAAIVILFTAKFDPKVAAALGVVTLVVLGFYRFKELRAMRNNPLNVERAAKKDTNAELVFEFARRRGGVTNNDVERLLGVSDSTAERYLAELETEGRLEQLGRTGHTVSYRPK